MGIVTIAECDIFKTVKPPVDGYGVTIVKLASDNGGADDEEVLDEQIYLSNRALIRLLAFVDRGMSPPSRKGNDPKTKDAPVGSK